MTRLPVFLRVQVGGVASLGPLWASALGFVPPSQLSLQAALAVARSPRAPVYVDLSCKDQESQTRIPGHRV